MDVIKSRWSILQIVNLGTFMSTLDVGIVNVVLPTMAEQFAAPLAQVQWVVTSYLLTMVALLPILGKWSDRMDRSKVYSYGFLVFAVGSLFAAYSPNLASMIVSRIVQGIGASMILSNSQAMVRKLFPNHEIGKALAMNAVVISIGTLSGPAVGGLLMEWADWSVLFLINVPLGLLALLCGLKWFPRDTKRGYQPLDVIGSVLLAISTALLLLGAVYGESKGFTGTIIALYASGTVLLVLLFLYERQISHGVIDKVLYTNRGMAVGNSASLLMNVAQMSTLIPITFYMQQVLEYPTRTVGLMLALQPVFLGIASPVSGWYRDKYGAYYPTIVGASICAISMLFIIWGGGIHPIGIALHLSLFGVGMGLFQAINNAEIMSAAPPEKISLIGSMLALIRYFGMIIGIGMAVLMAGGMGATAVDPVELTGRIKGLFGAACAVCFAMVLICLLRPKEKPQAEAPTGSAKASKPL
ncbi:MFS transporter [Paenibacillus sp. 32O-W]|uniref:MFS transporter n=1 Tax=Paenibacillus sp. 32O-W TaxID=1695218 RepID=UPI0011A51B0A|nr:MFS transporter [Paenibacillus sp. 32O-W]